MVYRSRADDVPLGFVFALLVVVAIGAVGWIWNIVKIVGSIADPITAMLIVRCVGVFLVPLGAILGFL
jgi:hypothetical protein